MKTLKLNNNIIGFLIVICFTLILLHGFENSKQVISFKVDNITIGLLVLCFLPIFQTLLSSVKAGGVELQFKDYSVHEQIFMFLDGMASKQEWTFFNPRKGEVALGQGIKVLIDELLKNRKKELKNQVEKWLESKNDNHKWFAAEVIGYGKISELKNICRSNFEKLDIDEYWEHWQLNCLWAYSTFKGYEPLISRLKATKNKSNNSWMTQACKQMIIEEMDFDLKERLQEALNEQEALNKFSNELIDSVEKKIT